MPVFDASALNDNDETLINLRAILARPRENTQAQPRPRQRAEALPLAQSQSKHFAGIPLIVGVAVSITLPSP
ncbi:hypothetical protein MicloDRAFT_00024630 [Microvirga lotononidis]|uniref:Uncharacterized protein n=1 Tax=Microvirga lotononidis TaxID=864069 RepID=I4YXX7_9HYPH|nr:hypothetical protein MicloDRAFT_00024630 [Microvirga lotononidis]